MSERLAGWRGTRPAATVGGAHRERAPFLAGPQFGQPAPSGTTGLGPDEGEAIPAAPARGGPAASAVHSEGEGDRRGGGQGPARERRGALWPASLILSPRGLQEWKRPPAGPERADERRPSAGARSLLPPGRRKLAARGVSRHARVPEREKGAASPPRPGVPQGYAFLLASYHPDRGPLPDSWLGISNPFLRLSPLSSGPWYAPGDRCLGIFNIWDAANAEVK